MNELLSGANSIYILILIGGIIGGWFAGRRGFSKEVDAATDRLNETLGEEINALRRRLADIEADRDRQDRILAAIRYALRKYRLRIIINHEFVTIIDEEGKRKTATFRDIGRVMPIKSAESDEDDENAN